MLPEGTMLGRLTIDEVFVDYDGPQLFSCSDDRKRPRHLIAMHAPATDGADNWLYVYVGVRRLKKITAGCITLHAAFSQPKDGKVLIVSFGPDGASTVRARQASQVPDDWFPLRGERLGDPGDGRLLAGDIALGNAEQLPSFMRAPAPMWEMTPTVINYLRGMRTPVTEVTKRTGRSVIDIVFRPLGDRSEMPAGILGTFLLSIQGAVEALAPSSPPGLKATAAAEFTRLTALPAFPGSFGVRLDTQDPRLFPDPRVVLALKRMATLLASSSDHDAMRVLLKDCGQRGALKFRAFAQALGKSDSDVSVEIGIPNEPAISAASLTRRQVTVLVDFLKAEAASSQETFTFRGRLVGVTLGTKFFALEDDERIVSGRIAEATLASMDGKVIGAQYVASITAITDMNDATGLERTKHVLNTLELVG
jgi:hypothetical protein